MPELDIQGHLPFILLTASYAVHIAEEYFMDWRSWAMRISGLEISWREFALANTAVIVLGIAASATGFYCPLFSFLFVGLSVVNAVFAHILTAVVRRSFSPGLITSAALFLPLGIWAYAIAAQRGILSVRLVAISLIGGAAIMCVPVACQILKNRLCKLRK
jgi:hypothetical protein